MLSFEALLKSGAFLFPGEISITAYRGSGPPAEIAVSGLRAWSWIRTRAESCVIPLSL